MVSKEMLNHPIWGLVEKSKRAAYPQPDLFVCRFIAYTCRYDIAMGTGTVMPRLIATGV